MPGTMASKRTQRFEERQKRKLENKEECRPRKRRRVKSASPPPSDQEEYAIDRIVKSRTRRRKNEYLVAWVGYPGEDTWEEAGNLPSELIEEFKRTGTRGKTRRRASTRSSLSCTICKSTKQQAAIQCDSCEKWSHFSCVGLKRAPPKDESWFCANCDDGEEEKERSDSRSPFKDISRTANRQTAKNTSRSPSIGWDSDFEGEITSEEDDECKDENYDPGAGFIDAVDSDEADDEPEDIEMCDKLGNTSDVLRSDSESVPPMRSTRSITRAKSISSSGSPVVMQSRPLPVKKVVRRVNPEKMELDSSDGSNYGMSDEEESDSSVEVLPSERRKQKKVRGRKQVPRPPIGLRGVDSSWLMSLTWDQIENVERDHQAPELPPFRDYVNGCVLSNTGEVDEKNCAVFNYDPEKDRDTSRMRLHVWRSDAKHDLELKRDEPLGNFRADYNGTESTSLQVDRRWFAVERVDIVSQIRFNVSGAACIRVTSDFTWEKEFRDRIASCQSKIGDLEDKLRQARQKLEEFKSDPEYPFPPKMLNPQYDAYRCARWESQQPPQILSQSWRFPNFARRLLDHPKHISWERAKGTVEYHNNRIQNEVDRQTEYQRMIALRWRPLQTTLDKWIPVTQEDNRANKRADLSPYFSSRQAPFADTQEARELLSKNRQQRLELLRLGETSKSVACKIVEMDRQHKDMEQALSNFYLRKTAIDNSKFLFAEKVHNVSVTIKNVMNDVLPQVPDAIVSIITGYAEDELFVKDVTLNPNVLIEKLTDMTSHVLESNEKFLLPYILETNCPSHDSTLVENREQLFYHSSNVPQTAVKLIEALREDENGLKDVVETDLRGIGTKLFNYQVRSYVWMENLEQKVLRKHRWYFGCNDMYIDLETATFDGVSTNFPIVCDHVQQEVALFDESTERRERFMSVSGGILADEVGLGKTLTTISCLFGNRPTVTLLRSLKCVKATLIIAPSHLLHQWREEIEKHVHREWDIVEVPTKIQYMKMTPQRLYCVDVLLVSTQFLKGGFYNDYRARNKPWLESVKFWRCVVDEGHELVEKGNGKAKKNALEINAVHYWYLSGTPFPSPQALVFCCEFIRLRVCDRPVVETQFLLRTAVGKAIERLLVDHLVMRNTKVSVDELHIPKRIETPAFVKLHPVELGLYRICRDLFPQDARQVCTDIASVSAYHISPVSPDQLQIMAQSRNLRCGLNVLPQRLRRDRKDQLPHRRSIVAGLEADIRKEQRKNKPDKTLLRTKKRELAKEKKRLTRIELEIEFCESADLKQSLETWKIVNRLDPLRYATLLLGSKFSKAVLWISNLVKSHPNVRIIAFSNFNKVLRNYHKYLMEVMHVKTVFCMGNVYVRRRAVQSFQSDDPDPVRVILLSIQKSASGANLTRATHVCLLDPVAASASQAVASEEQAVGRALRQGMSSERHCQIIRFVAQGTIEQELFERNQKQREQNEGTDDAL